MLKNMKEVDAKSDNHKLWDLFARTYHIIAKAREVELSRYILTREQARILDKLIEMGGKSTLNQLAKISIRRHNTVSAIIQRMEKLNLVTRTKSKISDEYQITITTKGIDAYKELPNKAFDLTFSTLSSSQRQSLVASLNKIEKAGRNLLGIDFVLPIFTESHDKQKNSKPRQKKEL